jgi:hypothetical protein
MIRAKCDKCRVFLEAPDRKAGQTATCPKCSNPVSVPAQGERIYVRPPQVCKVIDIIASLNLMGGAGWILAGVVSSVASESTGTEVGAKFAYGWALINIAVAFVGLSAII